MWVSGFLPDQHTTKACSEPDYQRNWQANRGLRQFKDREGGDDGLVVNGLVLLEKHMGIHIYIYIIYIYT